MRDALGMGRVCCAGDGTDKLLFEKDTAADTNDATGDELSSIRLAIERVLWADACTGACTINRPLITMHD